MKKIYNFFIAFIIIVTVSSCGDDFLDIKPLSIFTPESIYVDEAGFEGILVTLRKNLRPDFYGQVSSIGCELIASDIAVGANKAADAVHNFNTQMLPTGTGNTYNFHEVWDKAYNQIRNANVILSRIDATDINDNAKNTIKAEAYFHRAYWYYRLVHIFGDVPFLNKEYTSPKIDFYTHSRTTILNKIQSDMAGYVDYLPENVVPGAVSKAAGYHLLAKIYLANCEFQKAEDAASAVINDGIHSLMTARFGEVASNPMYNVIWDLHQKSNKSIASNTEGLLVVQDRYGFPDSEVTGGTKIMRRSTPAWWNTYIKDPDGKRACVDTKGDAQIIKLGRGGAFVRPDNYFNYNIWHDATDLRHDTTVNWFDPHSLYYNSQESAYYGQPVDKKLINPIDTIHCWFPFPYYKIYVEDEERPDQPYGGHSDWYVYRLAETYLIRAEAHYWQNELEEAANDINAVRERALATPISAEDVTIDYILDERARELYMEEFRKTELTRISYIMAEKGINGYSMDNFSENSYWYDRVMEKNEYYKAGNIMWGSNMFQISAYHVLWPIPANVIDSNLGGVINQNYGYIGYENNIEPLTTIDDQQ